jgi:hypothetical protein
MGEPFELPQHFHCFIDAVQVLLTQGLVGYGVFRILVRIVFPILDYNGSIVTQLIAAHHLYIALDGPSADPFIDPFIFIERIRNGVQQHLQGPAFPTVPKTLIDGLVPDECIPVSGHLK